MKDKDLFLTLAVQTEGYYMERGSKFLAYAFPVENEEQAHSHLLSIKKEHPKARHYCSAIRLNPDASLERSTDDGEPSGSAGRPILGQLIKNKLTNVHVIVVRYFGGTKLGIPGLIEAYKTSTANAIAAGTIIERKVLGKVKIKLSYEAFPHYLNHFKQHDIPVVEESFGETASLIICFPISIIEEQLIHTLHQLSQMDFNDLQSYTSYLGIEVELLPGEVII